MQPRPITYAIVALCALTGCVDEQSPPASAQTSPVSRPAETDNARPASAQAAFREGARLGKQGRYREALQAYTQAIARDPGYSDAYTFRALTYFELGDVAAAMNDLNQLVALKPDADAYRLRADLYARGSRFDQAIADYDRAVALKPDDASTFRNRAMAYAEMRNATRAQSDIAQAIRLEPGKPKWRYDRAMLKARQGDYHGALVDADEALRLAGGAPELRPGEAARTDKFTFECLRLIADLERAGARRTQP